MNEERKVEYVIQYQVNDAWIDSCTYDTDTEAFNRAKTPKRLPFPEFPHRIVERIINEAVLFNINPIKETKP